MGKTRSYFHSWVAFETFSCKLTVIFCSKQAWVIAILEIIVGNRFKKLIAAIIRFNKKMLIITISIRKNWTKNESRIISLKLRSVKVTAQKLILSHTNLKHSKKLKLKLKHNELENDTRIFWRLFSNCNIRLFNCNYTYRL